MTHRPYPSYKDSGIEWLGEVPEHWGIRKLRQVARLESGHTPSRQHPEWWIPEECTVPWISLSDVWQLRDDRNIWIRDTDEKVSPIGLENSSARLLPAKTVILSRTASVGFSGIMAIPMATTQDFVNWVCSEKLMPEYLLFVLRGMKTEFKRLTMGSTHQTIYMPDVAKFDTPLPSLPEQQAIAAFLDRETAKIDGLVAEQERLIELLTEKRSAVISHAVTRGLDPSVPLKDSGVEWLGQVPEHWKVGKCGFYISILSGFAFPSLEFSTDESETKLLRGINVGVAGLRWDETVYWRRTPNDGLDIYEMHEGDLVIGMDRPLISDGMRVAKVKGEDLPCLLLQRVAKLSVGSQLLADFLYRLLASEMFVAHFSPETTGVSVPHISPEQIYNFVIPIPPLPEQQAIAAYLDEQTARFDALMAEARRGIELLKERRTALISAAVTGKIDVREAA